MLTISSISFLFGVLPIFLIIYLISKPRVRKYELLVLSLFFYYFNDKDHLPHLIALIIVNYLISLAITKERDTKKSKVFLLIGIVGNTVFLIFNKYIGFIKEIVQTDLLKSQSLMTGISFIVFGLISYLVDVYQQKVSVPRNPAVFADYVVMFPKVLMGPISRYTDMKKDFDSFSVSGSDVGTGAKKYMAGFIKKMIVADNLGILVNQVNSTANVHQNATIVCLWVGAIAYSLQLFFDFSGYSDMAIGIARMMGFHIKENFDHPYCCRGFTDFWRRWHISLSEWFRDYVYIPLGGSRQSLFRNILNLLAVWVLTGIWHGAGYTFVVWGLIYFLMIVIERYIIKPARLKKIPALLWRVFTLLVINFNWVIFSHNTLKDGINYCLGMIGYYGNEFAASTDVRSLREYGVFLVLGVALSIPIEKSISKRLQNKETAYTIYLYITPIIYVLFFLWATSFALLEYHNPFMYQQF